MINILKNKQIISITLNFIDFGKYYEYPKELPLPKINEFVLFNGYFGNVTNIKHLTEKNISNIEIICKR
jgi:hypothetical protein